MADNNYARLIQWTDRLPDGLTAIKIGKIFGSQFERIGLFDKELDRLSFVPSNSVAIGMSPDETQVFSWRIKPLEESGAVGRGGMWIIERYQWPKRRLIDSYRVTHGEVLGTCWPDVLHVLAPYDGKVLELKCRDEDHEQKLYIVYGKKGVLGETVEAEQIADLLKRGKDKVKPMSADEAQAAFNLLDANFPKDGYDFSARPIGEQWLPQALVLFDQAKGRLNDSVPLALFMTRVARFLQAKADLKPAEALARRSLEMLEKLVGEQDAQLFLPLLALANIWNASERPRKAEPFSRRALAIAEAAFGNNSTEAALALHDLANVICLNNKEAECVQALRRARKIREAVLPPGHPDTAATLSDLGTILTGDKPEEAEALLRQALALREAALGESHPDVAITLDNLATLLDNDHERMDEALELAQRAVAIFEKCLGPHHPDVAVALANMAVRLRDSGKPAKAEPFYRRALVAEEAVFGLQSTNTGETYHDLGSVLRQQNKKDEALTAARCALAIHEVEYKEDSFELIEDLELLALVLHDLRKYDEAVPYFKRALSLTEKHNFEPGPYVGRACYNLAHSLNRQNRHAEAIAMYRRALKNYEARLEKTSVKIAAVLHGLVEMMMATGELQEAETLLLRAADIDEAAFPGSDDVLTDLIKLGRLYEDAARWEESAQVYQRMLSIAELKGPHPHTYQVAFAANQLSRAMVETGNPEAAVSLLQRSLAIYEAEEDMNHDRLRDGYLRLANLLVSLGRPTDAKPHFDRLSELDEDDDEDGDI